MIHIEIIDMQINALKYPMQDIKKLLILGVMIPLSILIVPFLLALGYHIRVMKNTTEGKDILPEFDNFFSMLIDGVKYFIVIIVYALIPLIIMGIVLIPMLGVIIAALATSDLGAIIAALGAYLISIIIGIIAAAIASIIVSMIIYIAVVNMAHTGKFGAAFRIGEIIQRIKNIGIGKYILWYITDFITFIIVSTLLSVIMIIPFLGIILVILIGYPYLFLFMSRSAASIYMEGS